MSACVMVCDAVHTIDCPGMSSEPLAGTHDRFSTFGSVTVTGDSVIWPMLVAVIW